MPSRRHRMMLMVPSKILFSCLFGAFVVGGIVKVTQPCVFFTMHPSSLP